MNVTKKRDIEKTYALPEFIAKLRRLADALESGARFDIQVAGERVWVPAGASYNIEHERSGNEERSNFRSSGEKSERIARRGLAAEQNPLKSEGMSIIRAVLGG